jgi:CheY-like chemotaxis protein
MTSNSGADALAIIQADQEKRIKVLFTDINMGAMSGWELIEKCRKIRPDLRFMVITAEPENSKQGKEMVADGRLYAYFDKINTLHEDLFDKCKQAMLV